MTEEKKKIVVEDVIFEVQKRGVFSVYTDYDQNSEFLDENEKSKKREEVSLPEGWKWLGEWKSEGSDSWEYGKKYSSSLKEWSKVPGLFEYVRRRKWIRQRVKFCTSDEIKQLKNIKDFKEHEEVFKTVQSLSQEHQTELSKISNKSERPNILLLGGSGAGKSSLVNAVFGKTLAEIGEGKPITQSYTKYSSETSPVCIYDSRGIEHGYAQKGFTEDTEQFFEKLSQQSELENHIHCVWYVLDLTQARFQPFEADFCKTHLKAYPLIFVLNKADSVSTEVRDTMINCIKDHQFPNTRGIFATIANCKNFDTKTCDKCKSTKIKKRIQGDSCTVMCKECNAKYTLEKTSGIKELAQLTVSVMPNLVRSVYINSLQLQIFNKEKDAKKIISKYAEKQSLKSGMKKELEEMISDLLTLYSMEYIKKYLQKTLVKRYVHFYEETDFGSKFNLYFNDLFKKHSIASSLFIASGLEISRSIMEFKIETLKYSIEDDVKIQDKKEEKKEEKEGAISNSVAVLISSVPIEKDFLLEKLFLNLDVQVDSHVISNIDVTLQKQTNITQYIESLKLIDGTKPFLKSK